MAGWGVVWYFAFYVSAEWPRSTDMCVAFRSLNNILGHLLIRTSGLDEWNCFHLTFSARHLNSVIPLNAGPWGPRDGIFPCVKRKIVFRNSEKEKWKFYIIFSKLEHVICVAAFGMDAENLQTEYIEILMFLFGVILQCTVTYLLPFCFLIQLTFQVTVLSWHTISLS